MNKFNHQFNNEQNEQKDDQFDRNARYEQVS